MLCQCGHEQCIVHTGGACENVAQSNELCSDCAEVFSLWVEYSEGRD